MNHDENGGIDFDLDTLSNQTRDDLHDMMNELITGDIKELLKSNKEEIMSFIACNSKELESKYKILEANVVNRFKEIKDVKTLCDEILEKTDNASLNSNQKSKDIMNLLNRLNDRGTELNELLSEQCKLIKILDNNNREVLERAIEKLSKGFELLDQNTQNIQFNLIAKLNESTNLLKAPLNEISKKCIHHSEEISLSISKQDSFKRELDDFNKEKDSKFKLFSYSVIAGQVLISIIVVMCYLK